MARVTVEDCIEHVQNRFALVLVASKRTKQLMRGSKYLAEPSDNKFIVNSLREIAASKVRSGLDLTTIKKIRED
jgi:DNA-directed RNA polymerase subunit omega